MKELVLFTTRIIIGKNLISEVFTYINKESDIHIITDDNVAEKYLQYLNGDNRKVYIIKAGEQAKSLANYQKISEEIIANHATKKSIIIALGGGVVLDLAGFLASTIFRGIRLVYIPTTVIGQIDAAIGGKNGINLVKKKNMLGTFYQPELVLIDPQILETLPLREYKNGLGEVIKMALIGDKLMFNDFKKSIILDEDLLYRLISLKISIVKNDFYDLKERRVLNFGHTMGHAIEASSNFLYSHGEAVVYGMIYALKLGVEFGITDSKKASEIIDLFHKYDLGLDNLDYKIYKKFISYDKKRTDDAINFVFLADIEKPVIKEITLL